MNFLIWNCRGAGGHNFHNLMKDCIRIYQLDFIAILEPRISGSVGDRVINRIGFSEVVRVEAMGFSGGIWCMWKSNWPPIQVVATSRYCIHLLVNENSPSAWYLSIVYASPIVGQREFVWQELRDFKNSIDGPWALAGDFNAVTSNSEKIGGLQLILAPAHLLMIAS